MTLLPARPPALSHRTESGSAECDGPTDRASIGHGANGRGRLAGGPLLPTLLLGLGLGLAGCGDGGSAGDAVTNPDTFAPSPIEPLVGTWNLGSDWDGRGAEDSGEALLVIRPVGEDDTSEVRLYDFDTVDGCYFLSARGGEAEPDGARREQVFMNNVFPFESAVLDREGATTLLITYFDGNDTNGNGDRNEQLEYRATAVGQAETDIASQVCS